MEMPWYVFVIMIIVVSVSVKVICNIFYEDIILPWMRELEERKKSSCL